MLLASSSPAATPPSSVLPAVPANASAAQGLLIIEDDPSWQLALQSLVPLSPHLHLLGCAATLAEAHTLLEQAQAQGQPLPQWIWLDWQLAPNPTTGERDNGLSVAQSLQQRWPALQNHQFLLISATEPQDLPPHPFLHYPKQHLRQSLLPWVLGLKG